MLHRANNFFCLIFKTTSVDNKHYVLYNKLNDNNRNNNTSIGASRTT